MATMEVDETTVKELAEVTPNRTPVRFAKWLPLIVTDVPPAVGPEAGVTPLTVGAAWYVNWSAVLDEPAPRAEAPPPFVTVTSTTPADSAGSTATMEVDDRIVKE